MKRFLFLSLLALPLLVISCEREIPNEPASVVDDGALLKPIQGVPGNNVSMRVRCGRGVTGSVYVSIYDADTNHLFSAGVPCDAGLAHSFVERPPAKASATFWLAGGSNTCNGLDPNGVVDIPSRLKCPISGKADAVAIVSYLK